jgi:Dolichyl-phosphate-mannose-protein mannosyltransferase
MAARVMTLPRRVPDAPAPAKARRSRDRRRISEPVAVFLVAAVVYLGVGALMAGHNIVFADAMSRVGNAYYVLFSRDPHLPAIGFVWNPLPSLVLLPLLPFRFLAPWLVSNGIAGVVQSALTMAGTVGVLTACLGRLGVPRAARLVVAVLFALQPMILLYAGSGLSEPMLLLFLVITMHCLVGWLHGRGAGSLVGAGLALGLAYLTRYEALAPAAAVAVLVGAVTWWRASGPFRDRLGVAVNDVVLVAAPFSFTFALWAAMAKILVGQWMPTFSSTYGNSAQVQSGADSIRSVTGSTLGETVGYLARQVQGLAPLLVVLVVAAAVLAWRRRDVTALVAPAVLGSVSAFSAVVLLIHSSFGWLRFQIAVIPLAAVLAGTVVAAVAGPATARPRGRLLRHGVVTLVAACLALAVPVQFHTLTDTSTGLAREESPMLHSTFSPQQATFEERRSLLIFQTEREIAAYVDRLNPGDGTVLTDTAYAYSVVMASSRPTQFVITSDRDFAGAVADPAGHGVRYLLVPAPELGHADALQARWPGLYDNGAGIATPVRTFEGAYFGSWRLYRVR